MAGRRAMVTGASGGIGKEIAIALAKDGFEVTLVARNGAKLEEVRASLAGAGHRTLAADLSVPADIARVAGHLAADHPDVLVNNAGVGVYGGFAETALDKQQAMTRLNIDALMALSHAFLAKARSGDALVNVASTLGFMAYPYASGYSATKAFVVNFSEGLWREYRDRGIFVTALCPGVTATDFHHASGGTDQNAPPASIAQTPAAVAATTMAALARRGSATVISGASNNMMVFMTRFMTRKSVINMMGSFAPKPDAPKATASS